MGYDHGDSFPFDCEPNGILFGSKSKGKLSPRSYLIKFERKWKQSFLSVPKPHFGDQIHTGLTTTVRRVVFRGTSQLRVSLKSFEHHIVII